MTSEKPGRFPFTRGIHKDMYRQRLWTMRQYSGFTSAEESNKRYKYLLENGVTGLSVAFDLPTQIGYDSDHPMSKGEVGKVGVPISTLENMESLLDGIPLDKVSTSMTINSTAAIMLAFYIAVAEKQELSLKQLKGTIQNDILKEYIARLDHPCASSRTYLNFVTTTSLSGIPFPFPGIISAKPAVPPCRNWPLPLPMELPMCRLLWTKDSIPINLGDGYLFSLMPIMAF